MSYIGKNPEADSVKLKGSATEPSGTAVDGQVYFNTGAGSISKGMKVYKNSQFVAIDKQLGDADTMQLLKAADIPAIDFNLSYTSTTVGGQGAVPFESSTGDFDGTAAFTNSSTGDALLTDDSADLVFHYTTQATNSADNDFWGIPLTVPRAFRGGNLVLEFKYRTEIATGTMDDGYFNIAIQDRSSMILQTQASTISAGAIAAGANVLLTAKTYTNPVTSTSLTVAVGDRVFVESGTGTAGSQTNDIVDCYITSVSSTDNNVTLSKDIVAVQSGKFVTGWLTGYDTGGQINAFASDTNKDGTSKKLAFKTDTDTQQVSLWFFVKGTSTVKHELFFDNVLLSGNKFLQVGSQLTSEYYSIYWQDDVWYGTSAQKRFNANVLSTAGSTSLWAAGPNTPPMADSKYLLIENSSTNVTQFKAKQNIKFSFQFAATPAAGSDIFVKNSSDQIIYRRANSNAYDNGANSFTVVLAKNDYIYFDLANLDSKYSTMNFTMTPETSPVVILESQDEIFTDTVEYTPTWAGLGTVSNNKATWSRVGDKMHIMGSVTAGTQSGLISFTLPSGYNIDGSKLGREQNTSNTGQSVGHAGQQGGVGRTFLVLANTLTATDKLYFGGGSTGTDIAVPSTSMGSTDNLTFFATVPIQGWSANFNPLLSMPLVNIGTDYATYNGQLGSTSVNYHRYVSSVSIDTLTDSGLATITQGSSTAAFRITASVDVYVSGNFSWGSSTATEDFGIVAGTGTAILDSTKSFGNSDFNGGMRKTSGMFGATGDVENSGCGFILKAGEHMIIAGGSSGGAHYSGYSALFNFTFQRVRSNTNLAHIIKPAVAILSDEKGGTVNGGSSVSTGWDPRVLNTVRGDSWFVTLTGTGTTGLGGTNDYFTLIPGEYELEAFAPFYNTAYTQLRLFSVTKASIVEVGTNNQTVANNGFINGPVYAKFTVTNDEQFTIAYRCSTAQATYGLGEDSTFSAAGDKSVFTQVKIRKLK